MLRLTGRMAPSPRTTLIKWLIWVTTFTIATVAMVAAGSSSEFLLTDLRFTQQVYNCTIPENSLGKTFATPASKMGIYIPVNQGISITYQIINFEDDLFKVEEFHLGDFSFLLVRTHSNSYGRLNRELTKEYHLKVKATARDKEGAIFETTTDLIIFISDLNDLQPLFDYRFYNISAREDTPLHASIAHVSAFDGDEGVNAQIYYSFIERTNVFAIHPTSGVITLTQPLNYFLKKKYSIDMLAEDRGPQSPQHSNKRPATLNVHVLRVNYFPPDISVRQLPFVLEPGADELILANVNVEDRDIGDNGKVQSVEIVGDNLGGLISLQKGEQIGEYRVRMVHGTGTSRLSNGFNVTLNATDAGDPPLSASETFHINVVDAGKVSKFTQSVYEVKVEEVAPPNTPVMFVSLVDANPRLSVRFDIIDGNKNNLFKINQFSGLISTSSSLDTEKVSRVLLKIVAYDMLQQKQTAVQATLVNITVVDFNDNDPEFDILDNVSEIYIQENLPIGSSVFTIKATDADSDENGKLSFTITNAKDVPFEIDPLTGVIKTITLQDYETMKKSHKLNLRVSDWGTPFSRESEMIFTINLQDVNDNEPKFEKVNCSGYVSRDTPVNTELLIVPAIDVDMSAILQYQIDAGNDDLCFRMNHETARIHLNCSLGDGEEEKRKLQVVASDGKYSVSTEIEITVVNSKQNDKLANSLVNFNCEKTNSFKHLEDLVTISRQNNPTTLSIPPRPKEVKNNAPLFNSNIPTKLNISESTPVGTVIAKVKAVDIDAGYNGMLVYVVKSGDIDGHFKVGLHTGDLMILSPLDREIRDRFDIMIEVSDLGLPSLSANVSITVTVMDENDNAPKFEQDQYSAVISENIRINSTVTQVSATDKDLEGNAAITYAIVSDTGHFSINPVSGIITVNKPLDREKHPVHKVLVRASDHGEKQVSLSSTATVTVEVTDVNDIVPEFTPDVYSVRIREDLPLGAVVTVVTAADTDEGKNGEVTYHLLYGEEYFDIDSETGVIRLIKKLDFEIRQVHNISVRAEDGGVPPLVSVCLINVEVVDINENLQAPVFENFFVHGYVNENEPVGTTVMFVTASDPDGDGVTYSIRDGSGLGRFNIDSNGTIFTTQVLDRETATHYWLTVYAQDHGLVPLHTRLEVYVEVKDTNDHIPMTFDPVYYGSVPENSGTPGLYVTQVQAFDLDKNPTQRLTYKITRFDSKKFFQIDSQTGIITTTGKQFDRENKAVHQIEVTVSDNGDPALTYQTRVFVRVDDDNDNRPQFTERLYRIKVADTPHQGLDIPVFQVMAWDLDEGRNGELRFDIKKNKDDSNIFMIHPQTGLVSATGDLKRGQTHHFVVRAADRGKTRSRKSTAKVRIEVLDRLHSSKHVPRFTYPLLKKQVMEDDPVGHMVELVQAYDIDGDKLYYSIIEGDPEHQFYIGLDAGNLMVARTLDWTVHKEYNLTIQVTDGVHFDNCTVHIEVIDINDHPPLFTAPFYRGSFPESVPVGTTLLKVEARDLDHHKLIYTLPSCCNSASSLQLFHVSAETGEVLVRRELDREVATQHNLTVMVSDEGVSANRNFTRVTINILDHNDHPPSFLAQEFRGRVFETAALGTSVVQVTAADQDRGLNAEITYSMLSGNVGGAFSIDSLLGIISVAKELDRNTKAQYNLVVMATDRGDKPLSSTASVIVEVTISDNAPPKFDELEYMAELHENQPMFTNVYTVTADCRSSVIYTIIHGNEKGIFAMNPNSGVVFTKKPVDYEEDKFFNLTIRGTSVIHSSAHTNLLIHVLDENDNAPVFIRDLYVGNISESAQRGSVVLNATNEPLVVLAKDRDSNQNALLSYEIRDEFAKHYFTIDPNTGAIRTAAEFDREKLEKLEFSVEVRDMGKPQQRTNRPAKVVIYVNDVNDSPPRFSMENYVAEVLLPTYNDVIVIQLYASDPDTGINSKLAYSIAGGNEEKMFSIDSDTGAIFVVNETGLEADCHLNVQVTDGLFVSETTVEIQVSKTQDSPIKFSKEVYEASVRENSEEVTTLTVVQIVGRELNEHYSFSLLNGRGKFEIGLTSGVLITTGVSLDREEERLYTVVVEVRHEVVGGMQKAHAIVEVTVEDENDNNPMFVNQPYHAVLVFDSQLGNLVKQVTAVDRDAGMYGHVTFSVKSRGDMEDKFTIDPELGRITLSHRLSQSDVGKEITLAVGAADGDSPPRSVETTVRLTIISKHYPVFEQQVYRVTVPEYYRSGQPVTQVSADSPTGQKLIYTIIDGDKYGDFDVDFNIGFIQVRGVINYDETPAYNLTIQAMETQSLLTATTLVMVKVKDLNNAAPKFDSPSYMGLVSEADPIGFTVLTVTATDTDSGLYGLVHYSLLPVTTGHQDVDWFVIDPQTGVITTRKYLDREKQPEYTFLVEAIDGGEKSLSSTATVKVKVTDLNDNAPVFVHPTYRCVITDQGQRGQFVMKVTATDPDETSQGLLRYAIFEGNDQQAFQIDEQKGIITLSEQRKPELHASYELNVSVSDGVFTNFVSVSIKVQNSNNYTPRFTESIYIAEFPENYGEGMLVTQVSAVDDDAGIYGMITYTIPSDLMNQYFRVDADSGEIFSVQVLDREQRSVYNVPVAATDNGGRMTFTTVHISIIDQNDFIPQFLAQEYKMTLPTNLAINATIVKIQADDEDSDENGEVDYSFSPGTSDRISQVFRLDPRTGLLSLKQGLEGCENEIFQFFVEAIDHGTTPMKNSVPVDLWVTGDIGAQPSFSQPSYSFFMLETNQVGTVIATVSAVSSQALEYIIVPGFTRGSNNPVKFGINGNGQIHVVGELDMEMTSAFTLTVQAQTLTQPPLVQQATVKIRLMDVNDNDPYFESSVYKVTIPENLEPGITVIQVVAHDLDKATKFIYSFDKDMQKYAHLFGLDSSTGVITLLSALDREEQELYNLTIWVQDGDGADARRNSSVVEVQVMDHNDNPPIFTRSNYQAAVNEDAYKGTIVRTVITEDKDVGVNIDVRYYITDGDPQGKFQILKNGAVFVNGILDRELVPRYTLIVAATDGGFVTTATVNIDILDANDNKPVCDQLEYHAVVSEDVTPSWVITRVRATDADEYGSLLYALSGTGAENFYMEPSTGALTAARVLDREITDHYHLVATAFDHSQQSCTMDIYVTVSDVNDNAPTLVPVPGPVSLSEGADVNTLVYRVAATDPDLGINRQVAYSLKGNADGLFKINTRSGLIQLAHRLDRETTAQHTITVVATDQGTPQLTSEISVQLNVLDVNDNPPEFEQTTYTVSVRENAVIGQLVVRVLATSRDVGVNAKIAYSILGGNEQDRFVIDAETGAVTTKGLLDHETAPSFVLTVRAKDHGEPPLSNMAYIQVTVTDDNDNPPIFPQKVYMAQVREDVQIGSKVIQVLCNDLDSDPHNKAVNYTIEGGDHLRMFDIHPTDGSIVVRSPLDRESVSSYSLLVRATNYHLIGETKVNIQVLDANDSPPRFTEDNYTIFVQEDREITSCVLTFEATDDDIEPNGPPFTFDIVEGDRERRFRISAEGQLCIAGNLNRQITATYEIVVRVYDNGTPAMYSDVDVSISVIEESTFSPEVSNMDVSINSYLDEFPGGVIGTLHAVDGDKYDILEYKVASQNRHLFDIDKKDGRIIAFAGLDAGDYAINISVTDGKYTSYGSVNIEVNSISEDMITNSVSIRFEDMGADSFIKNYKRDFQKVLKRQLNVKLRDVEIISIQKSMDTVSLANRQKRAATNNLDVLFAVKKGQDFIPQDRLKRKAQRAIPDIQKSLDIQVLKVFTDICEPGMCEGGDCVGYVEFDKDSLVPILMDGGSFVSARHQYTYECVCPNGNIGDNCLQSPTSCVQDPCPHYKLCSPHPIHGYQCTCPPGKVGRHCEKDIDNRCDNKNCHRGDTPITFSGNSYARWTLSERIDRRLSLSLRIKTKKDSASIMYAKGRVDYSILELVNGMVQYRFDCGSGEGLVMVPNQVSDGHWHTIMVERRGNHAEIFLDGQFSAITMAPGINDVLNLDTSDVYFGAEVETYTNGYVDIRKGFRGCIEDIRIYNVRLPVSGSNTVALSQDFKSVDFSCRDSVIFDGNNVCSSFPCMNGGQCENTGRNSYICKCGDRYRGSRCEIDNDPCQRQPCLNNGVCENIPGVPNEFKCNCLGQHTGYRCEYGKFCKPNPCRHGGSCIEGPADFQCLCRLGYEGKQCHEVVNVCLSNPCQNGGQCLLDSGAYTCNCSRAYSGQHCEMNIVLPSITSNAGGMNSEEIYAIAGIIVGLILIVLIFVLVRIYRRKKNQRRHANITAGVAGDGEVYLNLLKDDKHVYKAENTHKVDNMNNKSKSPPSPLPPPVPDRPASYTPSGQESMNTLNNFDSLGYGGAADDHENMRNIPAYNLEFLQTFAPPQRSVASIPPTVLPPPQLSDADSVQKENWEFACQNILQNYMSDKHSDKLSKMMPIGAVMPMSHRPAPDTTSCSSLATSDSDDDQPGYHWDTSDWAPEKSLPNISEVPVGECPDSPGSASPHSNESNTHVNNTDPSGYYNTDGEYIDSEYVGDSEYADNDAEDAPDFLPNYEEILAEQSRLLEDYDITKRYHWDTSDWAPEKSLPNISEVPVGECPDSPGSASPHSNESNTHVNNTDPSGYYNTDGEYIDSEYVGDSEYADNDAEGAPDFLPNYEEILAEQSRLLEDYDITKRYHWDTSDWAPEKSLPNISEVPVGECPDSPGSASPHSNESNTHVNNTDPSGYYNTDGEYIDSEYVGDSEYANNDVEGAPDFLPNYEEILAEQSRLLEDYDITKRYHWDTSDWAPEKSLPNISEVPVGECPDSPGSASPHSNESNTHVNNTDPSGYYNTDGEYIDSEYVGDSEYANNDVEGAPDFLPNYEEILAEQSRLLEDYDITKRNYNVHPNYYLPLNSSFSSENNGGIDGQREEIWPAPPPYNGTGSGSGSTPTSSEDDNDSVLHYGFPPSKCGGGGGGSDLNRLSMITTDSDLNVDAANRLSAAFTTDSEFNGDFNRATAVDDDVSDISGLCEIEDSELNLSDSEDENTPLPTQRIHTEV